MNSPEGKPEVSMLQSALAAEFGMQVENLTSINPEDEGDNSEVFSGNYEGRKVFVKTSNDPQTFVLEVAGLELFQKHGVPGPRTLIFKEYVKSINQSLMVQTAAVGISLNRLSAERSVAGVYEEAGKMLKKIHDIKLEGFGTLRLNDGRLVGDTKSWKNYVLSSRPDVDLLKTKCFLTDQEIKILLAAREEIAHTKLGEASFLHGDFQAPHIFTDGTGITGIIDLGGSSAGDPRNDIAKSHYFLQPENIPAFDRGYGNLASDPLVTKHLLMTASRKVEYRIKHGFTRRFPKAIKKLKTIFSQMK